MRMLKRLKTFYTTPIFKKKKKKKVIWDCLYLFSLHLHVYIWFSTRHISLSSSEPVIIEQIVVTMKNLLDVYEDALENNRPER